MTRTKRFDWFIPALQISECTTPMCRAALQIATLIFKQRPLYRLPCPVSPNNDHCTAYRVLYLQTTTTVPPAVSCIFKQRSLYRLPCLVSSNNDHCTACRVLYLQTTTTVPPTVCCISKQRPLYRLPCLVSSNNDHCTACRVLYLVSWVCKVCVMHVTLTP